MTALTELPNRPLRPADVAVLVEQDLTIVPYGGVPEADDVDVYAVKVATGDTAHALGYDARTRRWERLASVDAPDLAAADRELDAVLDDWAQDTYGGEFDVLKPQ